MCSRSNIQLLNESLRQRRKDLKPIFRIRFTNRFRTQIYPKFPPSRLYIFFIFSGRESPNRILLVEDVAA